MTELFLLIGFLVGCVALALDEERDWTATYDEETEP